VSEATSWTGLGDAELLELRFRDLGLTDFGPWLGLAVSHFERELARAGLQFRPSVWLSDEWFSPAGVGGFAMPFYLARPRLARLERAQMGDVEGGSLGECLKLMRHEAGHALQHGYRLEEDDGWAVVFGDPAQPYPERYRPDPSSRDYVTNLRYWYGQAHPDEDFAESFAVWLDPQSRWRERYRDWPALAKLEYVDHLMKRIGRRRPRTRKRRAVDPVHKLDTNLVEHYRVRRARYGLGPDQGQEAVMAGQFRARQGGELPLSSWLLLRRRSLRRDIAGDEPLAQTAFEVVFHEVLIRSRLLKLAAPRGHSPDFIRSMRSWVTNLLSDPAKREWISV